MRTALRLCLLIIGLSLCLPASARPEQMDAVHWTTKYDRFFKKYTKRYFGPNFDWKWFKAQAIAESGLKPLAASHMGAQGLMQILPSTYAEIREQNPHFTHIHEPRWNIAAGIYYNRYLYRYWAKIREEERLFYAFGSYNAGLGGVLRAYKKTGKKAKTWKQVAPYAPDETRKYVKRIRKLRNREEALQAVPKRLQLEMLSYETQSTNPGN